MTRQELGDASTSVIAEGAELTMERIFDAPRELVWTAMASAGHIPSWWGPHGNFAVVAEWDLRPGGKWRLAAPEGSQGVTFAGEFVEVVPPERFVRTSSPDIPGMGLGGPAAVETITLEDLGGKTRMIWHGRFPSEEVLGFAISQGMAKGVLEQLDRLADLLASLG